MAALPSPSDVVVTADRDQISASVEVPVSASTMFDIVSRPANHARISGDGTVRGRRFGPDQLTGVGDRFGLSMKMFGIPYRMTSTVKDFEADRRIAWAHPGGHLWSWRFEPLGEDRCRVVETFDLGPSKVGGPLRLLGFPKRHRDNLVGSVTKAAALALD